MSSYGDFEGRLLSKPVRVHWAGWETDTYKLQQAGWDISVAQCLDRMEMRMVVRHRPSHLIGQTNSIPFHYMRDPDWAERFHPHVWQMRNLAGAINIMGDVDIPLRYARFKPVDAKPQMTMDKPHRLEDMVHFAGAPLVRTQALVLPEATVDDLLKEILERQQEAKTQYFSDQLWSEGREMPKHKFHAQIISLAA